MNRLREKVLARKHPSRTHQGKRKEAMEQRSERQNMEQLGEKARNPTVRMIDNIS